MYRIFLTPNKQQFAGVIRSSDGAAIPCDPANTDYANFKREINEGTAQLQDADGNLMTAEQAKNFVKELP